MGNNNTRQDMAVMEQGPHQNFTHRGMLTVSVTICLMALSRTLYNHLFCLHLLWTSKLLVFYVPFAIFNMRSL